MMTTGHRKRYCLLAHHQGGHKRCRRIPYLQGSLETFFWQGFQLHSTMLCNEVSPVAPVSDRVFPHKVFSVPRGMHGEGSKKKILSTLYIGRDIKLVLCYSRNSS